MKKFNNKKGFTLMEMLIVVAIIAVLVAIAIPTMSDSLEKSKEAADMANIRSVYAEIVANYLTDNTADSQSVTLTSNTTDWKSDANAVIAGVSAKSLIGNDSSKNTSITVSVDASGVVKIGTATVS